MENGSRPLVSIGVPVYNGASGLPRALDGLLQQDYPALEIIISDNGSTDDTPAISRACVGRDTRVKYFRSDVNRGASWNFNRVFELSSGKYFMWAAYDDEREPGFVSACVARLEAAPEAVLCQARTAVSIEGHQGTTYLVHLDSFDGKTELVERYRETLYRFPATAIYGLYRASAVRKTRLFQSEIATDLAFVQELSLYGPFTQVSEVLFHYRARARWNTIDQDVYHFLGKRSKPWWYLPFVALFFAHCRRLWSADVPAAAKCRLFAVLMAHQVIQIALKTLLKLAGALCPRNSRERLGVWLYGLAMHNPNVDIIDRELYVARVCKPRLGWWR